MEITAAMVEAALDAFYVRISWRDCPAGFKDELRRDMRAALTATLVQHRVERLVRDLKEAIAVLNDSRPALVEAQDGYSRAVQEVARLQQELAIAEAES